MSKHHVTFPAAALLGAALSVLPGCGSTMSSNPSPHDAQAQDVTSRQAAEAWKRARVGDRVTYVFSATQGPTPGEADAARKLDGQLTLSVVSVQQPWVYVRVAFADAAGNPLPQTRLSQDLVVPVRSDVTRPVDVPRPGQVTAERPSFSGRNWEATRYVSDQRPVDGPLRSRLYANDSTPLYLTRGLLEASTESAGFRTPGGVRLSLRDFQEGSAEANAPAPSLDRPLGPGAYYDRKVDMPPTQEVLRVCFTAERGYVLRAEGPLAAGSDPCSDFSKAEPEALEEVVMGLPWEALVQGDWPPSAARAGARGTFTVGERSVPTQSEQRTEDVEGTQHVSTDTYAADPWAPGLSGLPYEARFQSLFSGSERVGTSQLVQWGQWLGGQPVSIQ
uniref:Lipoprotein n=1 Tax=Myxococcus virescens TaxID=83456 RepID=A0A0N7ATE3_9BACT|nr:lipoprotein [Myxococcus virescens]